MSMNSFGHLYRFTTWGESHGKAIGVTIDGCPPRIDLTEKKIQNFLDKRKPGQNKLDQVMQILHTFKNMAFEIIEVEADHPQERLQQG